MSKSKALRNTTDSYEGGRLPAWSTSIFVHLELMKLYKVFQIGSIYAYKVMTIKISTQDGTALSEMPTEMVLEGFFKSELQDSVQLQTVLAL